jgi:hypothetical protein
MSSTAATNSALSASRAEKLGRHDGVKTALHEIMQ